MTATSIASILQKATMGFSRILYAVVLYNFLQNNLELAFLSSICLMIQGCILSIIDKIVTQLQRYS